MRGGPLRRLGRNGCGAERGTGGSECGTGTASPGSEDFALRRELLLSWAVCLFQVTALTLSRFQRGTKSKRRGSGRPAGWERHGLTPLLLEP